MIATVADVTRADRLMEGLVGRVQGVHHPVRIVPRRPVQGLDDLHPSRGVVAPRDEAGAVVHLHVRDGLVDPATWRVSEAYRPIGRLYGDQYCTTRQRFDLPGPARRARSAKDRSAPPTPS